MRIKLNDSTEADSNIALNLTTDGKVSGSAQKVIVDNSDTPPTQTNDGDPISFTLSDDDAAAANAALAPIISKYIPNGAGATGAGN
jgi:hypothetical protein